jgi:hypothetical protein
MMLCFGPFTSNIETWPIFDAGEFLIGTLLIISARSFYKSLLECPLVSFNHCTTSLSSVTAKLLHSWLEFPVFNSFKVSFKQACKVSFVNVDVGLKFSAILAPMPIGGALTANSYDQVNTCWNACDKLSLGHTSALTQLLHNPLFFPCS